MTQATADKPKPFPDLFCTGKHKQAGEKQQEAELKKFAAVIEQTAEEVVITNVEGMIQYVNPAFEKNTGFDKSDILGKNPRILKSGFHDHLFYKNLWHTILNKKTWKGKIINQSRDGRQLIHDATISPILDTGGDIISFVSVRRDITEQETIEKRLQQTHKMETIGALAGGIAHDFNNILTGIMGYTELVIEDLEDNNVPSKTLERLENVVASVNRAKDLVKQILTFSRSTHGDRHPVDVTLLIKEVTKLLRASLPSTIKIEQSLMSSHCVMADPINIHQVLMNICTNAKDAMEKTGGVLSISTTDAILDKTDLAGHENTKPGKFILISIADTGTGISGNIIKKIMEPFFTTKAKEQGTGMGLFVVHGIVKGLGGFITLTSKINTGSKFDIYLPACSNVPKI
ncbi:MAG: PAS domain S-box protein [Deltaproteobacteria bacterium]|nr:PAS domain S-box protein [Deltaproteobacteria bacterium]